MQTRVELTTQPVRPGRLLLLVLATAFVAECIIMKVLPYVLPEGCGDTCTAVADAVLLSFVTAPFLWVIAVLPVQRLARSRMHFLQRALTSQEEERRRITRDIHDGIGQSLTSLLLGLRALEENSSDPSIRKHLEALRKTGAEIHSDLRRIVRGLRPAILDQSGLAAAIERLMEDVRPSGTALMSLDVDGIMGLRLNADLESTAFRILQEALSNAWRHSDATHIHVVVAVRSNTLELAVIDDGKGFDPNSVFRGNDYGNGLISIRERVMIYGGRAEIRTSRGDGTKITVVLPLRFPDNQHD